MKTRDVTIAAIALVAAAAAPRPAAAATFTIRGGASDWASGASYLENDG